MKKLLLSLLGVSFLILFSFSANTEKAITFSNEFQPEQEGCPECKKKYLKCTDSIYYKYAKTVEKSADKLKADSITREEYKNACARARLIRDKALKPCTTEFNKCCLDETRKNQNKQKELDGNSNTIM
ncbi:hypothetical protein E0W68_09975 [Flavobacterium salilacus subsp. salilacus]|uniref:hypothetical protein n=1 Tax=Flavobacterium TaxID=237 RepID=UPI001075604F|nr:MULTISPECIES: hypothetical protein [Flavobacterium]KAF2518339.1 hypothetical protein E0W68_09975 [Flavobacterium salilacus subsp. salilacus]MBE1615246.1 hypothetical protein [Flavobacterium sp. SaA2.13]